VKLLSSIQELRINELQRLCRVLAKNHGIQLAKLANNIDNFTSHWKRRKELSN